MDLITGLIIAVIAFAVGILSGKIITPNARRIKELEQTIEENIKSHQSYKENVAEHFSESANLFGDITQKYRSLHEHMSSGAYSLCDRRNIPRELSTSHVNILAIETPDVSPILNTQEQTSDVTNKSMDDCIVDVSRQGLSPLDIESQLIIQKNKIDKDNTAEIIDLDSQRTDEDVKVEAKEQAKDYAIKAKGVINHNSLNRDDVAT